MTKFKLQFTKTNYLFHRKLWVLNVILIVLVMGYQSNSQTVKLDWVNQYAGPGANTSCGDVYKSKTMVLDAAGYIYNTGNVNGEADFDPGPGVTNMSSLINGQRRFLTKSDPDGNLIWVKQFGNDASFTNVNAIDLDADGNIYLAGYFRDTFDFDPGPGVDNGIAPPSNSYMFVIKLDSAGNYLWGKQIGEGTSSHYIYGMVVDDAGNIFTTGRFAGVVDFNPDPAATDMLSGGGAFVLKWTTNGDFVWVKQLEGAYGYAVDLDAAGNVYSTGYYSGANRDFNPGTGAGDTFRLSPIGHFEIYISKLDPNGDFVWARSMGTKDQDQAFSISVDSTGNSYITGIFKGNAYFDDKATKPHLTTTYNINANGDTVYTIEAFVAKFDPNGNFMWANSLYGDGGNWGYSVAVGEGRADGVYATGVFRGSAMFDTLELTPPTGQGGTFLIKLNSQTGAYEWARQTGANSIGTVVVDTFGNILVAGWFNASVPTYFDPNHDSVVLNKVGTLDGVILKYKWCSLSDTITETACKRFEYLGEVYTQSGQYTVLNPEGCDSSSIITLELTIYELNPVISVDGFTLGTNRPFNSYQWLLNDEPIQGAIQDKYTVTENGDYRVAVTDENGCMDTSDIYKVENVTAITDPETIAQYISIYPNPAQEVVYINSPVPVRIAVSGIEGKHIKSVEGANEVVINDLAEGVYLFHISDMQGRLLSTHKVVKIN